MIYAVESHKEITENTPNYFDICTAHLVQFTIQTNKCTTQNTNTHTHINNILYILSTSTYFDASASSSGIH
jgi:hypothetical protein